MKVKSAYRARYPEAHKIIKGARFAVLVAHRRFGKTVLAINHLIEACATCEKRAGRFAYIAPTRKQAKEVAWDYLKRYSAFLPKTLIYESDLAIKMPNYKNPKIADFHKITLFGADNPDSLRGLYFDGVVMDEVGQMKPFIWEEILRPMLADRRGWALFIGTPKGVNLFSRLYFHAMKEQSLKNPAWAAMRYTCYDTGALASEEIEQMKAEMSDNEFRQEMLCDFTATNDDRLITMDAVDAGLAASPDPELARQWPLVVGVDIARFGSDASVFFPRRGLIAYEPLIMRKKSNTDVAQRLNAFINEIRADYVNIDQGQGTGVIDLLRDISTSGAAITEVPFGGSALQSDKYVNRRAEIWTLLREWLKAGGKLPGGVGEMLKAELTSPAYQFDAAGRLKLEPKEEIKKRLSHSTDLGDALALTFAIPLRARGREPQKSASLYDPFKNDFYR